MSSLAQSLPALILEQIVEYTVESSYSTRNFRCRKKPYIFFTTALLLRVCSAWRNAALDRIYRDVRWCSYSQTECCYLSNSDRHWTPRGLPGALATHNSSRIRRVALHFESSAIVYGSLAKILKEAPFGKLVLSRVSTIEFDFTCYWSKGWDPARLDESTHAQGFCDGLNRMFPNATSRIFSQFGVFLLVDPNPFLRTLVQGLVTNSTSIATYEPYHSYHICLPEIAANMRRLSIGGTTVNPSAIELIRRSATTLEDLEVGNVKSHIFTKIIFTDKGTPIVYPRMRSLNFSVSSRYDLDVDSRANSPGVASFPSLRKFVCTGNYPSSTDIIFRGNELALEYLHISLDSEFVQIFNSYGTHKLGRFPALRCVRVLNFGYDNAEIPISAMKSLLFSANAQIIEYYGASISFGSLGTSIGYFGQNITLLTLANIQFTLRETLQLIKHLPCLRQLGTDIELTDELSGSDRFHNYCYGECRLAWEKRRRDQSTDTTKLEPEPEPEPEDSDLDDNMSHISYDSYDASYERPFHRNGYLTEYLFDHLNPICTDIDFIEDLFRQYYPLSTALILFDVSGYTDHLWPCCKVPVVLFILCPTLRRIQTNKVVDGSGFPSVYHGDRFLERLDIDKSDQYISLISRLQLLDLSIH